MIDDDENVGPSWGMLIGLGVLMWMTGLVLFGTILRLAGLLSLTVVPAAVVWLWFGS